MLEEVTESCELVVRAAEAEVAAADWTVTETLVDVAGSCKGAAAKSTLLRGRCRLDACAETLDRRGTAPDTEYAGG